MAMPKTGPKIRKGGGSLVPELPANHPVYTRGFAIGVVRSTPSSKAMSTTGQVKGTHKGKTYWVPEASADDPIYKRGGYYVGVVRSTSPKATEHIPSADECEPAAGDLSE
jgi:hypothetical protein